MASDEELARLAQAGNREAFGVLVSLYEQPIYHLAYRLCGDAEEARDIAQEIFVRAYTRLNTYDAGRRFFPWLYRLGVNYCLNHKRTMHASPLLRFSELRNIEGHEDFIVDLPDIQRGPEELSQAKEDQAMVNLAIAHLPAEYRAVIALRYGADLDYEKIAEILNIPASLVKTRLHRARKALRTELEKRRFTNDR